MKYLVIQNENYLNSFEYADIFVYIYLFCFFKGVRFLLFCYSHYIFSFNLFFSFFTLLFFILLKKLSVEYFNKLYDYYYSVSFLHHLIILEMSGGWMGPPGSVCDPDDDRVGSGGTTPGRDLRQQKLDAQRARMEEDKIRKRHRPIGQVVSTSASSNRQNRGGKKSGRGYEAPLITENQIGESRPEPYAYVGPYEDRENNGGRTAIQVSYLIIT